MNWFLYDIYLSHERVKGEGKKTDIFQNREEGEGQSWYWMEGSQEERMKYHYHHQVEAFLSENM